MMTGKQLRQLRRGPLDLTQSQLSAKLGISTRTLSDYENADVVPHAIALAVKYLATVPAQA